MYEWHTVAISDFINYKNCQHKAYLNPEEEWNGWARPYFEKGEVERMRSWISELGEELTYSKETDEYVVAPTEYPEDAEYVAGVDIDGLHLYPIGSGSWIWEIVK